MNYVYELNKIAKKLYEDDFVKLNEKEKQEVLEEYNYQLLNDNI
jgi:hypothetical protein|tara:strand:+ start:458 stop:589 length:132 start_codon:yes stop_codon:yes gene_type:complete